MDGNVKKVIIIGSGPAGLTAGIYAGRAGLEPLIFAGKDFGGQLITTTEVENFPGFPEGIMGPKLMQDMIAQAKRFGAQILNNEVSAVDFSGVHKKITSAGKEYLAETVIIATGSKSRILGIPGEQEFWSKGVSTCATCDGAFYRGKVIAVVGGGDSAMEEANFLTRFGSKVYVIHRKSEFRASKIMQERTLNNPKIEILWNTEVKEVIGSQKVEKIKIFNNKENKESELQTDGFFLAIGHVPNTAFLGDAIELDSEGFVLAKDHTRTSVDGVFVAGDVNDHRYQQAITAAGMGCMAAMDAEKWLEERNM